MSPIHKVKYLISTFLCRFYSFIFDPEKPFFFFFGEMSTELDKILRSSKFCKLAFSSILARRKYNIKCIGWLAIFIFLIHSFAAGTDSVLRSNGVGSYFHVSYFIQIVPIFKQGWCYFHKYLV